MSQDRGPDPGNDFRHRHRKENAFKQSFGEEFGRMCARGVPLMILIGVGIVVAIICGVAGSGEKKPSADPRQNAAVDSNRPSTAQTKKIASANGAESIAKAEKQKAEEDRLGEQRRIEAIEAAAGIEREKKVLADAKLAAERDRADAAKAAEDEATRLAKEKADLEERRRLFRSIVARRKSLEADAKLVYPDDDDSSRREAAVNLALNKFANDNGINYKKLIALEQEGIAQGWPKK